MVNKFYNASLHLLTHCHDSDNSNYFNHCFLYSLYPFFYKKYQTLKLPFIYRVPLFCTLGYRVLQSDRCWCFYNACTKLPWSLVLVNNQINWPCPSAFGIGRAVKIRWNGWWWIHFFCLKYLCFLLNWNSILVSIFSNNLKTKTL